jgi:hypothetical protein
MASRYYHVTNGEWLEVPKRGYREQCCDCGLVHEHTYRINAKGKLEIKSTRHERATAGARKAFRFEKD